MSTDTLVGDEGNRRNKTGIWPEVDTWPGRMQELLPEHMISSVANITRSMQQAGVSPTVIEIGPATGESLVDLSTLVDPATHIIGIEHNPQLAKEASKLVERTNFSGRVTPNIVEGNGWICRDTLAAKGIDVDRKVAAIVANNNLAIALHHAEKPESLLNTFLDQSKELLFPHGVIILSAGSAALMLRRDGKEDGGFVMLNADCIEARFQQVNPFDFSTKAYVTDAWGKFTTILQKREDTVVEKRIFTTYTEKPTGFNFTNVPHRAVHGQNSS